jgi:hypothetical protein
MAISAGRMAALREHIHAESAHDIVDALIGGMAPDCFNDVVGTPEPFVGPARTAERYRKHWEGFPDFMVRVRSCAPTNPASSRRTNGAARISAPSWGGRRPASQCACAQSWFGISRATRSGENGQRSRFRLSIPYG